MYEPLPGPAEITTIEPPQSQSINSASIGEDATAILQRHSTPGMMVGTVGSMSPEQALGKTREIDQRSDIFSFGCILYEAVTGHKAFAGKDLIDSASSGVTSPRWPLARAAGDSV